jgi:5'-3' exonuclease
MTNYIFIDGSYFVFYRFHALLAWWRLKHKDEPINNPIENEEFVEKFKKLFVERIQSIPKLLSIEDPIIIIGKDCPRSDIWRNEHLNSYKGNRAKNNVIKPFFKMAYDGLFQEVSSKILYHEKLEADDCIAVATKHYLKNKENHITIITSDTDYLQLIVDRVEIYNAKMKPVRTVKNSTMKADMDLFVKIIMGDKSDNIPPVFPQKRGKAKAKQYYNEPEFFKEELKIYNVEEVYKRNKLLIDFSEIPIIYQNEIISLL